MVCVTASSSVSVAVFFFLLVIKKHLTRYRGVIKNTHNIMKNASEYLAISAKARNEIDNVRNAVSEILDENGVVSFDWEDGEAPSFASTQFGEDYADSYITKLYKEDGIIYADLHAYYKEDDLERVELAEETAVDWIDILDKLIENAID